MRAWCKTIVTCYIKWGNYNSFAPRPQTGEFDSLMSRSSITCTLSGWVKCLRVRSTSLSCLATAMMSATGDTARWQLCSQRWASLVVSPSWSVSGVVSLDSSPSSSSSCSSPRWSSQSPQSSSSQPSHLAAVHLIDAINYEYKKECFHHEDWPIKVSLTDKILAKSLYKGIFINYAYFFPKKSMLNKKL